MFLCCQSHPHPSNTCFRGLVEIFSLLLPGQIILHSPLPRTSATGQESAWTDLVARPPPCSVSTFSSTYASYGDSSFLSGARLCTFDTSSLCLRAARLHSRGTSSGRRKSRTHRRLRGSRLLLRRWLGLNCRRSKSTSKHYLPPRHHFLPTWEFSASQATCPSPSPYPKHRQTYSAT